MKSVNKCASAILVLIMLTAFAACREKTYSVDYGNSVLYGKQDMDDAVTVIMESFRSWETKCTMLSITYAGDDSSAAENLDYCNSLATARNMGVVFDECIVFQSSFHTPKNSCLGFNEDETYTGWTWYLARADSGGWVVLTSGYA